MGSVLTRFESWLSSCNLTYELFIKLVIYVGLIMWMDYDYIGLNLGIMSRRIWTWNRSLLNRFGLVGLLDEVHLC